ncbi:MAG: hypothetical protein AAGA85_00220 [Bacteroidota bacterium]
MLNQAIAFFGKEERQIRGLVRIAFAEGKLTERDIELLNAEFVFLDISEKEALRSIIHLKELWSQQPADSFGRFQLIYRIATGLMRTNLLTVNKECALRGILSVFLGEPKEVAEMIPFLKENIRYGKTAQETYSNLDYLMQFT